MRYAVLAIVVTGAAMLGGCSEGVFDPKGPVAAAERQILSNSLGIMLAIVIPTILATLGVAYWFRSSNKRAHYLPNFNYAGRLEVLVWSIPAMTVMLPISSNDSRPQRTGFGGDDGLRGFVSELSYTIVVSIFVPRGSENGVLK